MSLSGWKQSSQTQGTFTFLNPPKISSIASDPSAKSLFLYAALDRNIYKMSNYTTFMNDSQISTVRRGVSVVFGSVAFDWLTQNLYWTDGAFGWIAMMPAYTSDQTMYKVILHHNIKKPEGLTLDATGRCV